VLSATLETGPSSGHSERGNTLFQASSTSHVSSLVEVGGAEARGLSV
jgi:hypothetical protein